MSSSVGGSSKMGKKLFPLNLSKINYCYLHSGNEILGGKSFLPRAQSEREREKNSTSLWLLTFLKDRALGVGETRISLKYDTSSRQTFPGLIPTDDQEICLS